MAPQHYGDTMTLATTCRTLPPAAFRGRRIGRRIASAFSLPALAVWMALAVTLPIGMIFLSFLHPEQEIWRHLVETLLAQLVANTAVLASGVLIGTAVIGISTAWLTAVCEFPGRRWLSWALLLPLAIPTYVLAFVFIGLLDFSGPVQTGLRALWPAAAEWIPGVRTSPGVIGIMTLALYPYVYLLARTAFKTQGKRALEAVQALGQSRMRAFFTVALPMARPWIATGLMLVLMEALADFGAVSIFNYDTFTTAIYKSWFGFFSLDAAAQLASLLVWVVFAVTAVEQMMRSRMRFTQAGRMSMEKSGRIPLTGWRRAAASGFCGMVFGVAFVIPFVQLMGWVWQSAGEELSTRYLGLIGHTMLFSGIAAALIAAIALLLAYVQRCSRSRIMGAVLKAATLGYALPGTVLAVGIVALFNHADRLLVSMLSWLWSPAAPETFLQGSLVTVFGAYTVRFMTVGFKTVESAMHRITPGVDEAAVILGAAGFGLLRRIHLPILRNGVLTAALLVFVEVMKEMPITLMTRPFGWDTLAVKIFELTSEGEWQRAAVPAALLVLTGLAPVILLMRQSDR